MFMRSREPKSERRLGEIKTFWTSCAASSGEVTDDGIVNGIEASEMKSLVVMSKVVVLSSPMPRP